MATNSLHTTQDPEVIRMAAEEISRGLREAFNAIVAAAAAKGRPATLGKVVDLFLATARAEIDSRQQYIDARREAQS